MNSISKDLESLHKDCEPLQNIEKIDTILYKDFIHFAPSLKKENTFSEVAYH